VTQKSVVACVLRLQGAQETSHGGDGGSSETCARLSSQLYDYHTSSFACRVVPPKTAVISTCVTRIDES